MIARVLKVRPKLGLVCGFGTVSLDADGEIVTDLQGDQWDPDELLAACVDFLLNERQWGIMHQGEPQGVIVEAVVTSLDTLVAMGVPESAAKRVPLGLWLSVKVPADVLRRVESGELTAFSLQGRAIREPVT